VWVGCIPPVNLVGGEVLARALSGRLSVEEKKTGGGMVVLRYIDIALLRSTRLRF
jgi:hypothetical protein